MKSKTRAAFTLVELLTVIAIIGLLIAILIPSLGRAREMAHRTTCLENQQSIMKGVLVYSKESDGKFPNWGQAYPGFLSIGMGWDWDGTDGAQGWAPPVTTFHNNATDKTSVQSNTRNYYILVRQKLADSKNFLCASDPDNQGAFVPADPTKTYDFQYRGQVSFSMQYLGPDEDSGGLAAAGWALSTIDDPRIVFIADKSPLLRPYSPIQPRTTDLGYPYVIPLTSETDACAQFCKMLKNFETSTTVDSNGRFQPTPARLDDIQVLNSQNHRGEGQNITRIDGSGTFVTDPWQGAANDNIYTVQNGNAGAIDSNNVTTSLVARVCGVYPGGTATAANQDDILKQWLSNSHYNQTVYPDSFLVP